jgi:thioredoxin-related protein
MVDFVALFPRMRPLRHPNEASMNRALSTRVLPFALLLLLTIPGAAPADDLRWREWNAGLKEAAASKRPVIVDVYTDWCGWCKRMDRDVYARPDIRDYLAQHFVLVRLDAESAEPASYQGERTTCRGLAARFGVSGYPTTIFLRSNGEHLASAPGYVPADRFLSLLRYIGDGHMDRGETYEEYAAGARR